MRGSRTAVIEAPRSPGSTAPDARRSVDLHPHPGFVPEQRRDRRLRPTTFRRRPRQPRLAVAIWFVLSTRCTAQVISSDVNGLVT